MNTIEETFQDIGASIGMQQAGLSVELLSGIKAATDALESDESKLTVAKMAALAGCLIYEGAEQTHQREYAVMADIVKSAAWNPGFAVFGDAVETALAQFANLKSASDTHELEAFVKNSSAVASMLGSLTRAGVSLTPGVMHALLVTGAAAGAGVGTLGWLANRHVNEDSKEVEAKRQQAATYRHMQKEIAGQLANKGVINQPTE